MDAAEETPFHDFSAHGVSRDGSTIVGGGLYAPVDGVQHFQGGFIWSEASGMVHLPPAPWFDKNQIIRMRDISADGHVVLGTSLDTETGGYSATGERSFLWTASEGFTEIARDPQVLSTDARAISDDGRTVVGGLDATGKDGFFRSALWWREDVGPVNLGGLPNNTPLGSILYGISGNGRVAVGQDWLDSGVLAVMWDEYHGFRSIQEILEIDYGLTDELKGWKLEHAFAVSHNGLVIVGDGINPEGKVEAWRVVLDESELSAPIPGDADLSGDVGFEDFLRLNANYESGHFWYQGDFDGDYRVSVEDVSILLKNFGVSGRSLDVSAVPEPTCDTLLAIACAIGIGLTRSQSRLRL